MLGDGNQGDERALNANPTARTARKTTKSIQKMRDDKLIVPRIAGALAGETVGVGQWKAMDFPASGRDRSPFVQTRSYCEQQNQMIAGSSDFATLVEVLTEHTRAIGALVATLKPKVPDFIGTDYIASKIGKSKQWVGKMAEKGDIPKNCIAPKISGGRIWQFHRDEVNAWLKSLRKGAR